MESHHSSLRTADVVRDVGYSVQQVRNLERDEVLPPAARTPSGYRMYDIRHLRWARAYRDLAAAVGPVEARAMLRGAHRLASAGLLTRLDAAHVRLHRERRDVTLALNAAQAIVAEPIDDSLPSDAMSISELAEALGVRTSTLRHWDAEGLVVPDRVRRRSRVYPPAAVRDARIVHQLRAAGYRIGPLRELLPHLRRGRCWQDAIRALETRDAAITARSRALLRASGELDALLDG